MALLQISEPGGSPDPHQRRLVVGIDLGTTHSLVAAMRHGVPECLPDAKGRVLLPSAVRLLEDGRREVGHAALAAAAQDPVHSIVSFKRFMGRSFSDVAAAGRLPYDFVDHGPSMLGIRAHGREVSPVELSAEVLAVLRQRAEDSFDDEVFGAVVTVPAYFDEGQRQATKAAAERAGLNVLRLINEPTAAAIAYGLERGREGLYAVYDLGGGTFDVSVLRLTQGVFEVVATGGDTALGGDDFDDALADWAAARAGIGPVAPLDRRALLDAARAAKERLSTQARTVLKTPLGHQDLAVEVSRDDLESIGADLLARTLAVVRRVLRDAKLAPEEVAGVVLVGGATRMPMVRAAVERLFGRPPLVDVHPDEVVAIGAALHAQSLVAAPGGDEHLLLDVTPLSLGLETMGGLVERIIPRNSTIPTARAQEFTTFKDGQTAMALHVVQGERERVSDCRSLARFELRGIPPMVAGAARIRVTFQIDADGLLEVSATETTSGVRAAVTVRPSHGLADDQVARMLQEGYASAGLDMQLRKLQEARVEAERLTLATQAALEADGDLLEAGERTRIDAAIASARSLAQGEDADAITDAVEALARETEAFAAERMNRGIRRALAGRRVEDI